MRRLTANLPWHALQRRMADLHAADVAAYPLVRGNVLPAWRFASSAGSWLERGRSVARKTGRQT